MGRIGRLKRVTMGRIEAFLASRQDPERDLPGLVDEMGKAVSEAARAEAKAFSAARADRRRLDTAAGRVSRLEKGAVLALKAGETDTARQALAAQIRAEHDLSELRKQLEMSENALHMATQVRTQLQQTLEELNQRKSQVLSRVRELRLQPRPGIHISNPSAPTATILDWVARMEDQLEETEARMEIQDQVKKTLGLTFEHERARDLESDEQVEQRLIDLRMRVQQDDEHPGSH